MNEMFSDDHEKKKIKPGYKPTLQTSVAIKKDKENGMESRSVTQTILLEDSHPVQSSFQFNEEEGIFDKNCDKHVKSCPVCKHTFIDIDPDFNNYDQNAEITKHINDCLDSKNVQVAKKESNEGFPCQICGKDLSKYNTAQRQQHVNRCCDYLDEQKHKDKEDLINITCFICGKKFKSTKTLQNHMKKSAKENNISTNELVKLNRIHQPLEHSSKDKTKSVSDHGTLKGSLGVTKNCGKRKRKNKFNENVDEIELTTTSNLTDEKKKKTLGRKKRLKNNNVVSQVPALLLRDNDETKRVVAARAAAVLCNWADEDDEIQCTPALAPSSLVQNYCKGSNINSDEREEDFSKNAQDCSESNSQNNDEKCQCQLGESADSVSKNKEYFSVDSRRRLWTLSSVRAKEIPSDDFYVPNLLPKSTPVKTKKPMNQDNGNNKLVDDMNMNKSRDVHLDSPLKISSQSDSLTESQENNIEMLVELMNDDDGQLTVNYTESSDDLDETWLPSSGFCVRKDIHDAEEKDKEDVGILISELSCMVGNPLLSDVEIIAKNKNKILAHSFMLCARCKTLANFLQSSQSYCKDESGNGLARVELLDIDVRAVRAVLTYIYTACFVPVLDETLADVKELVLRWNLNINPEKWKVIKDECEKNSEKDVDQCNVGSLDVLLKSLWEGEEDMNGNEETNDKNVFAESFLDEELAGMTIKIYSQCSLEQVESCKKKNDKSSPGENLEENSLHQKSEKNDKAIFSTKTSSKESPLVDKEKTSNMSEECIVVNEDAVKNRTENFNVVENRSVSISNQSPSTLLDINDVEDGSVSISSQSPSSFVDMISSPEFSPLPENINDFELGDETDVLNTAISAQDTSESDMNVVDVKFTTDIVDDLVSSTPKKMETVVVPAEDQPVASTPDEKEDDIYLLSPTCRKKCSRVTGRNKMKQNDSLSNVFDISLDSDDIQMSDMKDTLKNKNIYDLSGLFSNSRPTSPSLYSEKDEDIIEINNVESNFNSDNDKSKSGASSINTKNGKSSAVTDNRAKEISCCHELSLLSHNMEESHSYLNDSMGESAGIKDCVETINNDDQSIDCYDDGGFNCDLNEFVMHETNISSREQWKDLKTSAQSSVNLGAMSTDEDVNIYHEEKTTPQSSFNLGALWTDEDVNINHGEKTPPQNSFILGAMSTDEDVNINHGEKTTPQCSFNLGAMWTDEDVNINHGEKTPPQNSFILGAESTDEDVNIDHGEKTTPQSSFNLGAMSTDEDVNINHGEKTPPQNSFILEAESTGKETVLKERKTLGASKNDFFVRHSSKVTGEDNLRTPCTPMLDYSNMATPDLKVELKQYGVRPLAKRKMVVKLKEIYNYTHKDKVPAESGCLIDRDNTPVSPEKDAFGSHDKQGEVGAFSQPDSNNASDSLSNSDNVVSEQDEDSDESGRLSQQSSSNISKSLMSIFKKDDVLYKKILMYLPISVCEVFETIRRSGIQCNLEQLKNYLDEQCITYTDPRTNRPQRRKKRGKRNPVSIEV